MIDNLNYYKVFIAVVETGSITKASELLFISQPAVSKSISNLESSLKVKLFERNKRGVEVTNEGLELYENIKIAFESIARAEDDIRKINELGIGQLKIGASTSLCKYILLDYLKGFINEYPHIKLIIDCHSTVNTIHLLTEGKIDIGLICKTKLPPNMKFIELATIHDIFITSKAYLDNLTLREFNNQDEAESANPWLFAGNITGMFSTPTHFDRDSTTLQPMETSLTTKRILEKSNLMMLEKGNVTRTHIDDYLFSHEIIPTQVLEINNMELLLDFATIGMGVSAVVKEFVSESLNNETCIELPLDEPVSERSVGFCYYESKEKQSTINKFLNYCLSSYSKQPFS